MSFTICRSLRVGIPVAGTSRYGGEELREVSDLLPTFSECVFVGSQRLLFFRFFLLFEAVGFVFVIRDFHCRRFEQPEAPTALAVRQIQSSIDIRPVLSAYLTIAAMPRVFSFRTMFAL